MITGNILALRRSESGVNIKGTYIYQESKRKLSINEKYTFQYTFSVSISRSSIDFTTWKSDKERRNRTDGYRARAKVGQ